MIVQIKELISIPLVSAIVLAITGAITKKYFQFHRRGFFSRSPSEKIKAVKFFRESSAPTSNSLAKAEQQFRLESFGLHRDWDLSHKIICFQADHGPSLIPSLKTILRYQGMYTTTDGNIHPYKFHKWLVPLVLITLLLFMGAEIYKSYILSEGAELLKSLPVLGVAFIIWCWVAACTLKVSSISKKLNNYIPPENDFKSSETNFSTILNNRYP